MPQGFIQLHRKIQEEWFWNNSKLSHLMVDLILRANHEAKEVSFKGEKRTINRGETITTYRDLGQELGSSKSTIERLIKKLIKGLMISTNSSLFESLILSERRSIVTKKSKATSAVTQ